MKPSQRSLRRILVNIALDGALAAIAAPIARFIADPAGGLVHPLWFVAGGFITLLLAGLPFRLPQQYWRFSGLSDLMGVAGGSIASALLFSALILLTGYRLPTPTFPIVHALILAVLLGAPRLAYRAYSGRSRLAADDPGLQRVILVGAGAAADGFIRAIAGQSESPIRVVGLLALSEHQTGRRIHGLPILGTAAQAHDVLETLRRRDRLPTALVVTEPDFLGPALADLIAQAEAFGLKTRRAPSPTALTAAERIELLPVAIEDLLNRPQVTLDHAGLARLIAGRRVLVTGAGGSIGSELARQVAALSPADLVLLDNSEYALWQIDLEISERNPAISRQAVIADIRDEARIAAIFGQARPELVLHAAALKHVPMVEANPIEGIRTNAIGTRIIADAARRAGTADMVLISTDKAVNPSSLMGATKRIAEMYCQALTTQSEASMRVVTVRFGNVLGSTGSVVPLFRRQLERGGPLTVTHPDMQRYFMTIREAVSLVLQAGVLGTAAAAPPGIFVLDMGELVRIVELARQMIRLAGLRPDIDVAIEYTGLRPGEKLFEELFHGHEPPVPTGHPGLLLATPRPVDPPTINHALDRLDALGRAGQAAQALGLIAELIPEFRPEAARPEPAIAEILHS